MQKRLSHLIPPGDLLITEGEAILLLDNSGALDLCLNNIFCFTCGNEKPIRLIDYQPYLTKDADLVLRGKCSGCGQLAARVVETGENPETRIVAKRIRNKYL